MEISLNIIYSVLESMMFGVSATLTLFGFFILYLIFGSESSAQYSFLSLVSVAFLSLSIGLSGLFLIL